MALVRTESAPASVLTPAAQGSAQPAPAACTQCGAPVVRRRRVAQQNPQLCLACDQRARRSAYFQRYYASHRERILAKNRRWAKDNKDKLVLLRQARQARQPQTEEPPRLCVDCSTVVVRALRCRRCYIRFRYASDPSYRDRRLATTRRWLERRQASLHDTQPAANASGAVLSAAAGAN